MQELRIKNILDLVKSISNERLEKVIDVGAQDAFISKKIADLLNKKVIALDINKPDIKERNIIPMKGNILDLKFSEDYFDLVICTEVLEHIQPEFLKKACNELKRITKKYLLIGVPYKQDLRLGRTFCKNCGKRNPPWGHVNSFDEYKLIELFNNMHIERISFVGKTKEATNFISTFLLDLAKNPYGTYNQKEPCIFCGAKLEKPSINLFHRICVKIAYALKEIQQLFVKEKPIWIHILFKKLGQ